MIRRISFYTGLIYCWFMSLMACDESIPTARPTDELARLFPDYAEVTIPTNIAPLNFRLENPHTAAYALLRVGDKQVQVKERKGQFTIPASDWKELIGEAGGQTLTIQLFAQDAEWLAYPTCSLHIAAEPIDPYIAYRLIEPGYELWNQMGIYQRQLASYAQTPIMENKYSDQNCMNCHSFCMQDPDRFLFHMRDKHAGTYLIQGDKIEKLNTKTDQTLSALVYPSWHPSGRYVAFSVNQTQQSFHANDRNRVEVFDKASDVVVYDVERHEVVTSSWLDRDSVFETFPTFSPDGRTLYFCSAQAQTMPVDFKQVKYSLCSIGFDPEQRSFSSQVDTLYSAVEGGLSASFPRVSPDGRWLLYTLSGYGNFSIWHKEADLWLLDLEQGITRPLNEVNSDDTESFHNWSADSRWMVFSSRRDGGLYTRLYFTHINEQGQFSKPFLMPQKSPLEYEDENIYSYNVPDFTSTPIQLDRRDLEKEILSDKRVQVQIE